MSIRLALARAINNPTSFAGGRQRNFCNLLHFNYSGTAKNQLEAFFKTGKVLGHTVLLLGAISKDKSALLRLLQLPFANDLPVQANTDKMPNENRTLQGAILREQHVILPSLQLLNPGKW